MITRVQSDADDKHLLTSHSVSSNLTNWKIVPSSSRLEILRIYHDDLTPDHF